MTPRRRPTSTELRDVVDSAVLAIASLVTFWLTTRLLARIYSASSDDDGLRRQCARGRGVRHRERRVEDVGRATGGAGGVAYDVERTVVTVLQGQRPRELDDGHSG
jgi:hypothetical protein